MIRIGNLLFCLTLCAMTAVGNGARADPSFDCTRVTSQVNRMICASPDLAARDSKLVNDFANMLGQGGIDAAALKVEEADWLSQTRNRCKNADCLARAYDARDAALLARSERAASPAAYDETRPFPAPGNLWTIAHGYVGADCGPTFSDVGKMFPGFHEIKRFPRVTSGHDFILPLERDGVRFAFLIHIGDRVHCRVSDVVTLPPSQPREAFLQCGLRDQSVSGFALRQNGKNEPAGFWSVEDTHIVREPLGVLGGGRALRCQEPEIGE